MKHEAITKEILGAFFQVYNTLGWGFLEKVYHGAMKYELEKRGLTVITQAKIEVYYEGRKVGDYFADFLVNNAVIIELKACEHMAPEHEAQLTNYLKATSIDVGLLLNFGIKAGYKRKIFETARVNPFAVSSVIDPCQSASDPRDPRSIALEAHAHESP